MTSLRGAQLAMRSAVDALAAGTGTIQDRLVMAERYFGEIDECELRDRVAQTLYLRIASALVSGGDEGDEGSVADAIAALDDGRAAAAARDMLRLYDFLSGAERRPECDRHDYS